MFGRVEALKETTRCFNNKGEVYIESLERIKVHRRILGHMRRAVSPNRLHLLLRTSPALLTSLSEGLRFPGLPNTWRPLLGLLPDGGVVHLALAPLAVERGGGQNRFVAYLELASSLSSHPHIPVVNSLGPHVGQLVSTRFSGSIFFTTYISCLTLSLKLTLGCSLMHSPEGCAEVLRAEDSSGHS